MTSTHGPCSVGSSVLRAASIPFALACALLVSSCGESPSGANAKVGGAAAAPAVAQDQFAVSVSPEVASRVSLGQVTVVPVRETLRVPGRIEVDETRMARIGAPVAGRITDLQATVGQNVKRGQALATINSTELSTAQLGYLRAISQRQAAARAATRAQQLYDADVIGAAELQRRQSEFTLAQVEEQATRDQLKVLGMGEAAIERLAETRTINSISTIVATVSGTVIERKVTEGQVVQPADTIFLVADLSNVWVVADIPEQSAGPVRPGEAVMVQVAALPGRETSGALTFVSPTVNPETRTVRARMDLPNPERYFKPAMLASVLIRGQALDRPVVPMSALVREENRDFIFTPTGPSAYRLQPVSLGVEQEGMRVVIEGLRRGDPVVVDGAFHLNNERKRRATGGR